MIAFSTGAYLPPKEIVWELRMPPYVIDTEYIVYCKNKEHYQDMKKQRYGLALPCPTCIISVRRIEVYPPKAYPKKEEKSKNENIFQRLCAWLFE